MCAGRLAAVAVDAVDGSAFAEFESAGRYAGAVSLGLIAACRCGEKQFDSIWKHPGGGGCSKTGTLTEALVDANVAFNFILLSVSLKTLLLLSSSSGFA
jgi:hypothetical protein